MYWQCFFFHNNFSFLFLTVLIDKIWGRPQKKEKCSSLNGRAIKAKPLPLSFFNVFLVYNTIY